MTLQEYLTSLRHKTVAVIGIGVSNTPLLRRLLAREGERYSGFTARWIPLEEGYFAKFQIEQTVDFILDTTC